jgi:superoxide dismutase, Cu-Zn family
MGHRRSGGTWWTALACASVAWGCQQPPPDGAQTVVNLAPEEDAPRSTEESTDERAAAEAMRKAVGAKAFARVIDRQGNVVGRATFLPVPVGVAVRFEGRGLPPGPRGFHIHEHGVCNPADDFESAGPHWSPRDREHGHENPEGPHGGDMPNLVVEDDGTADVHVVLPGASLRAQGADSLVAGDGTALVIHAGEDDLRTDPTGGSGPRIACGVVETAPRA